MLCNEERTQQELYIHFKNSTELPLFSDPIKTHKWMVSHTYRKLVFYTTAHISRKKCLKCYIATPVGPGVNKKKGIDSPWWDFWLVVVVDTGQKKSVQEEETFFFFSSSYFFFSFFILQDSSKLYFWAAGFSLPPHFTVTFFLTQMWKKKKINLFLNFFCVWGAIAEGISRKKKRHLNGDWT